MWLCELSLLSEGAKTRDQATSPPLTERGNIRLFHEVVQAIFRQPFIRVKGAMWSTKHKYTIGNRDVKATFFSWLLSEYTDGFSNSSRWCPNLFLRRTSAMSPRRSTFRSSSSTPTRARPSWTRTNESRQNMQLSCG